MEGHRRYDEDPEPRWYSGRLPYESGSHERPDGAYRLPGQRPGDAPPPAQDRYPAVEPYAPSPVAFPVDDPLGTTGGFGRGDEPAGTPRSALDAIRVPLRATEYPAVRPTTAAPGDPVSPGGFAPATTRPPETPPEIGPPEIRQPDTRQPDTRQPEIRQPDTTVPAYDDPTGLMPPVGARTGDGPGPLRPSERVGGSRSAADRVYRTRRPALAVVVGIVTALLMVPVMRLLIDVAFADPPLATGIVPAVLLTLGLPLTGIGLYGVAGAGRALDRSALLRPPTCYLPVGLVLLLAAALATA